MPDLPAVEPLAVAIAIGIPVLGKIVIVLWSLRGTKPADRPAIIEAIACLFPIASWQRTRRLPTSRVRKPQVKKPANELQVDDASETNRASSSAQPS